MDTNEKELEIGREKEDKIQAILDLYTRLINGETIHKKTEASHFGVSERTVQRYLDNIREFLSSRTVWKGVVNDVVYDRGRCGYRLEQVEQERMSDGELLAVMKILLESRAFTKPEMMKILDKLIGQCALPENRKQIKEMCANECFHYVELCHKKVFIDKMWEIALAVREQRCVEILYEKAGMAQTVKRKVEPLAILFSEFYFYMAAQIEDIDREKAFQIANDPFPCLPE